MIEAGDLRHVITIQSRDDSFVWSTFAENVRAKKVFLSGKERIEAESQQSQASVRFIIRYRPGVNETMQIVEGGDEYEILFVNNINGQNIALEILTKTIKSA